MKLILKGAESLKKVMKDVTIVPANIYVKTIEDEPGDAVIYSIFTSKMSPSKTFFNQD